MDNRRSIPRIAETIAVAKPSILCLQEVHCRLPWSGFGNQPKQLGALTGMEVVTQYNVRIGLGGFGLIIATNLPIMNVHRHYLPSVRERRGCLELHLETPVGIVAALCTHWGLTSEERTLQALAVAKIVNSSPWPVILCGDLNENPASGNVRKLLEITNLQDCDDMLQRNTYPAVNPMHRIDYIFHSPELQSASVEIIASLTSDHLPVVAEIERRV